MKIKEIKHRKKIKKHEQNRIIIANSFKVTVLSFCVGGKAIGQSFGV